MALQGYVDIHFVHHLLAVRMLFAVPPVVSGRVEPIFTEDLLYILSICTMGDFVNGKMK